MKLKLTFLTGHYRGHALEFEAPRTFVLGRSSSSDVQLYDAKLSRRHCAFRIDNEGVRYKDLASVNGTFLNGARVTEGFLKDGDLLVLGDTQMAVALDAHGETVFVDPTQHVEPMPVTGDPMTAMIPAGSSLTPAAPGTPTAALAIGPTCEICQKVIPASEINDAAHRKGRYVCARCKGPRVDVPGYALGKCLGEGAMGAVFEARSPEGRQVAIKVLKVQGDVSQEDRQRFYREAATTGALVHPNVVRLLGQGEAGPALYIIMEFIKGQSLKKLIDEKGPLMVPHALHVTRQIAAALEHARTRQIIHRDVKPENILVQEDGVAKLTDFGLAKSVLSAGRSGLTRPGEGMGTLPYMPPEQIDNALEADHRSDVYSLGATLYHMLTGKKPFYAKSNIDFFMKIMNDHPTPIAEFRNDVPGVVTNLIAKCMAKKPADRFQTAGDLVGLISQLLSKDYSSKETVEGS
ncbi:protein kinase [bacterium]|nr:protein kinase [bacterium]